MATSGRFTHKVPLPSRSPLPPCSELAHQSRPNSTLRAVTWSKVSLPSVYIVC
jgi:hypothetical protein